jgi:hypothetical protein
MRLFEHPDFEQAVIRAAEHFRPRRLTRWIRYENIALLMWSCCWVVRVNKAGANLKGVWGMLNDNTSQNSLACNSSAQIVVHEDLDFAVLGINAECNRFPEIRSYEHGIGTHSRCGMAAYWIIPGFSAFVASDSVCASFRQAVLTRRLPEHPYQWHS